MPDLVPCSACGGIGYHVVTRTVSREMAMDACEPSMEGMPIPDQEECERCEGYGQVPREEARPGSSSDGYWYEHTDGGIHFKPAFVVESGGGPEEYFNSPFVARWWKGPRDRETSTR